MVANGSSALDTDEEHAQVIALAGAKGGVGVSLVAANTALYLAGLGKRVVLVDADPHAPSLHRLLGMKRPGGDRAAYVAPLPAFGRYAVEAARRWPRAEHDIDPAAGSALESAPIQGLFLLDAGFAEPLHGKKHPSSLARLKQRLAKLQADFVVVDLGAAQDEAALSVWLQSWRQLLITSPEPVAIESAYRFMRRVFCAALRVAVQDTPAAGDVERLLGRYGGAPAALDLVRVLTDEGDQALANLVAEQMGSFSVPLALNPGRVRADFELGEQIRVAFGRRDGWSPRYLGAIDHDDVVRACARRNRALLTESPATRASRCIEKIARRLLAEPVAASQHGGDDAVPLESHHAVLQVGRHASDEEIRRQYRDLLGVFSADSLAVEGLFDAAGLKQVRARLDEAYEVLLDPERRAPYERSIFPDAPSPPAEVQLLDVPLSPAPAITPHTEFTGSVLRAIREANGIQLGQISAHTKVGRNYLESIEADAFDDLPAPVYVRGYLTEFARCLKLDPDHVRQTYLSRYEAHLERVGKT